MGRPPVRSISLDAAQGGRIVRSAVRYEGRAELEQEMNDRVFMRRLKEEGLVERWTHWRELEGGKWDLGVD